MGRESEISEPFTSGERLPMIGISQATRIFLAVGATDLRKGYDGLSGLVASQFGEDLFAGHFFVFANAQRTRLKILCWDGSGLWILGKRLEKGRFSWPKSAEAPGKLSISSAELAMLLGGLDLTRAKQKRWMRTT